MLLVLSYKAAFYLLEANLLSANVYTLAQYCLTLTDAFSVYIFYSFWTELQIQ